MIYDRDTLVNVITYHGRTSIKGCHCRWAVPGKSHAEHVADVYEASVAARAPGTPPSADIDILAQVVAELQDIYRSAVTEPETGNAWRDGYVTGYVRAMRTALTIAGGDTDHESPRREGADRRTT